MNHLEFHRYEMDSLLSTSAFERWAAKVEKILGHDLDGDQTRDGYSLDFASDAFDKGATPEAYAKSVKPPHCEKLHGHADGLSCTLAEGHNGLCDPL